MGQFHTLRTELAEVKSDVSSIKASVRTVNEVVENVDVKAVKGRKVIDPADSIEGFHSLFNRYVSQLVLEKCVLGVTNRIVMNNSLSFDFINRVRIALQTIMYSKLPGGRKAEFHTSIGVQYCALRRAMVRAALSTVQQDVFSRLTTASHDEKQQKSLQSTWKGRKAGQFGSSMKKLNWCNNGFVNPKQINEIQTRKETLQAKESKGKTKRGDVEDDQELALLVFKSLFTKMTAVLTRSRERCKIIFFEELGFLFHNWAYMWHNFAAALYSISMECRR